jgi:hypothetical protein
MSRKHSNELEMVVRFKGGESASSIARDMGLYTTSVTRVLKRHGMKMPSGKGKKHPGWKGGRSLKSNYWTVYAPEHPRVLNNNRVFEHILIAEKKYGRSIPKGQPIHHIDFDRQNNHPDNLHLCENHQEHKLIHVSLEMLARELFHNGIIGFKNGKYYLV